MLIFGGRRSRQKESGFQRGFAPLAGGLGGGAPPEGLRRAVPNKQDTWFTQREVFDFSTISTFKTVERYVEKVENGHRLKEFST